MYRLSDRQETIIDKAIEEPEAITTSEIEGLVDIVLKHDNGYRKAATGLKEIGNTDPSRTAEFVDPLLETLDQAPPDDERRVGAAYGLGDIGTRSSKLVAKSVDPLCDTLRNASNPDLRKEAARAIGRIVTPRRDTDKQFNVAVYESVVDLLMDVATDPSTESAVRRQSIDELGTLSSAGDTSLSIRNQIDELLSDTVEPLTQLLDGEPDELRIETIQTLSSYANPPAFGGIPGALSAVPPLIECLSGPNSEVLATAAGAIRSFVYDRSSIEPAVDPLISTFLNDSEDDNARQEAIESLGWIGSYYPSMVSEVVPEFTEIIQDETEADELRSSAIAATCNIGGEQPSLIQEAIPPAIDVLESWIDEGNKKSSNILGSFARLGESHPELVEDAIPSVRLKLKNGSRGFGKFDFIESVGVADPSLVTERVVQAIIRYTDEYGYHQSTAIRSLGRIGAKDPSKCASAVPYLVDCALNTDSDCRRTAIEAIGQIGKADPSVLADEIDRLTPIVTNDESTLRETLTLQLSDIGRRDANVVAPILREVDRFQTPETVSAKATNAYLLLSLRGSSQQTGSLTSDLLPQNTNPKDVLADCLQESPTDVPEQVFVGISEIAESEPERVAWAYQPLVAFLRSYDDPIEIPINRGVHACETIGKLGVSDATQTLSSIEAAIPETVPEYPVHRLKSSAERARRQIKHNESGRDGDSIETAESPQKESTNVQNPQRNITSVDKTSVDNEGAQIPRIQKVRSPKRQNLSPEDFQAIEDIGRGGQAVIKKVRLPDSKSPPEVVAIREPAADNKTLDPRPFLEEAETWETIDTHEREKQRWERYEHIVGVIDTGDDLPWIAMEYMDGGDLEGLLKEHPDGLPIGQALWVGECICEGLEIAHQLGRAHLDVKPKNVLLKQTDGWPWPKLADWGLARTLARETGTMDGLSVEYASPEHFDSSTFGDPDQLTDIYQTGALMYALLTGDPPVTGAQFEVMQHIMSEGSTPAPSERRPELPAEVDAAVELALERQKTERYDSITDFKKTLQAIRTDERLPRPATTRLGE